MIGALFVMVLLGFIYIEAYCITHITKHIKWLRKHQGARWLYVKKK